MRFKYRALTIDGRSLDGETDALDKVGLAAALGQRGLLLVSADRIKSAGSAGFFTSPIDPRKVTAFLGELAIMLRSGLQLDEALGLAAAGLSHRLIRVVNDLRSEVLGGASFVHALERHPQVFPREIVAMARIAEATGDLQGVLGRVAAQRERAHRLTEILGGALRYPAFLIVSACGVLTFFLVQVIPQFKSLLTDSGHDPGTLVHIVMGMSDTLVDNETSFIVGLAIVLVLTLLIWRTPAALKIVLTGFLRLPVVGGTWQLWRSARFLNGLAALLTQGVSLPEALRVLEDIVGVTGQAALARVGDTVRRGGRLHEALATEDLLPSVAVRMIRIGEESGELAQLATDAGSLYAQKLERRLVSLSGIVGPAAILIIAGLVGGLMVTIMSALVSVDQAVL